MGLAVRPFSIGDILRKLETEKGFSFARYGDGTFLVLLGMGGKNCDGASLDSRQADGLERSLRDTTITHGIGDLAIKTGAEQWLTEKGIEIDWVDCNVLHTAGLRGKLFPFVNWLRGRKNLVIGPAHLQRLKGFPVAYFEEIHPTEAAKNIEETLLGVGFAIERERIDTVLLSAGPSAPTFVSRIHEQYPWVSVLDTGSVWDPYVGMLSRKVFRKVGKPYIRELGRLNFKLEVSGWWNG